MQFRYIRHAAALTFAIVFSSAPGVTWADHAEHDDDDTIFEFVGNVPDANLPEQALSGTGMLLRYHHRYLLKSPSWSFTAPGIGTLVADRNRQLLSGDDKTTTWIGSVRGAPGGMVALTERNGVLGGFIDDGNRYWALQSRGQGVYRLFQVNPARTPPPANPIGAEPGGGDDSSSDPQASGAPVVQDVSVVWTPEVTTQYGGISATEAQVISAVQATNQSYINSLVDIQLNLVHMGQVTQNQSNNMSTTLSRLRSTSDGYYDEVHGWRDTHGADLVAMLTTETGYCGIAYLNHPQISGEDQYAFSVTSAYSGYTCMPLTFAHEIGHNQGLCHNREESCQNPAYVYGYGYRLCGEFRTVMSYSCTGATRVYHFANPSVNYETFPTGIAHSVDPNNSSEAARALNDAALDVAAWRPTAAVSPPAAPTLLTATAVSFDGIDLSFTDNAVDEAGFNVERSLDGSTWSVIATLGANVTTYSDLGLSASTTYYYQVNAYNGAGESGYTNTASDTTLPPPPPPASPTGFSAIGISGSAINLAWNDVSGETSYGLSRSTDGSSYTNIATLPAGTIAYGDTGLSPGQTYYYELVASNDTGDSSPASTSGQTLSYADYTANAANTIFGNVAGNLSDTHEDGDSAAQVLAEKETGGKKQDRTTKLDHDYVFELGPGTTATVHANAWKEGTAEDDFQFAWYQDGGQPQNLFLVSSLLSGNMQSGPLPPGTSGRVYIKITDTDDTPGNRSQEKLYVDHLYIRVDTDSSGTPPSSPTGFDATSVTSSQVGLVWNDVADEMGYTIQRSTDGSSWTTVASPGAGETGWSDTTVSPDSTYYYQMNAYNASGSSSWTSLASNPVSTPAATGITLTVSTRKERGVKWVDLEWSGANPASLWRDGTCVEPAAPDMGGGTDYPDGPLGKGGGSYVYNACSPVASCGDPMPAAGNCSPDALAVF